MTTCTHPLSTVSGVYVLAVDGNVVAAYSSFEHLNEHLADLDYCQASKARVSLCSLTDADADDITHLLGWEMFEGCETFEDWTNARWVGVHPRNAFVEFWFDEWGSAERADMERRKALMACRPVAARAVESMVA